MGRCGGCDGDAEEGAQAEAVSATPSDGTLAADSIEVPDQDHAEVYAARNTGPTMLLVERGTELLQKRVEARFGKHLVELGVERVPRTLADAGGGYEQFHLLLPTLAEGRVWPDHALADWLDADWARVFDGLLRGWSLSLRLLRSRSQSLQRMLPIFVHMIDIPRALLQRALSQRSVLQAIAKANRYYVLRDMRRLSKASELSQMLLGCRRVTVIAPHVDDESLGCGGTMLRLRALGAEVNLVFVTDGRMTKHPDLSATQIVDAREEEGREVASFIGARSVQFLRQRSTEISCESSCIRALSETLAAHRPDAILLPFGLDKNVDHVMSGKLVAHALDAAGDACNESLIFWYEVQTLLTSIFVNCLVGVDAFSEKKAQLMAIFRSQGLRFNYLIMKDAYYGLGITRNRRAEVFARTSSQAMMQLYRACSAKPHMVSRSRRIGHPVLFAFDYMTQRRVNASLVKLVDLVPHV